MAAVAAGLLLAALVAPVARAAEPVVRLSRDQVQVNGEVALQGAGLGALQATHQVLVGGRPLTNKTLVEWSPDEVRFLVRAEPGSHAVQLAPIGGGPAIDVGSVTVPKHRLPGPGEESVPGAVHLRLAPGADPAAIALAGDRIEPIFPEAEPGSLPARWHRAVVPVGLERERILAYAELDAVELAEHTGGVPQPAQAPNDPFYNEADWGQHALRRTRLPAVWELRDAGAPVALLDSGVDANHEDLAGRIVAQYDATGTTPSPCGSHGTQVASVLAANTDNGKGLAGAAWEVDVASIKVLAGGKGTEYECHEIQDRPDLTTSLSTGVVWAQHLGYKVANLSIECMGCYRQVEQDAITSAWAAGMFLAAAAGNRQTSDQSFPAAYDHVFAVANADTEDQRFATSNWGTWVDIASPGTALKTAVNGRSSYVYHHGATSFATPVVTATASLLAAHGYTNSEIVARLSAGADPLPDGWSATPINGGRLNAWQAFMAGGVGCVRDIPAGSFVQLADGSQWHVTAGGELRPIVDASVPASWRADDEIVAVCDERRHDFRVSALAWGYRPGSLVADGAGTVWLITTNGVDHGSTIRRRITDSVVMACYGWSPSSVITGSPTVLAHHPIGADVPACPPLGLGRSFPDGTIVRGPDGRSWVIDSGHRRPVAPVAFSSWFADAEAVVATAAELDLVPVGLPWGFRPGAVVDDGSGALHVVASDGILLGGGLLRPVSNYVPPGRILLDRLPLRERGLGALPVLVDTDGTAVSAHRTGPVLLDADEQR